MQEVTTNKDSIHGSEKVELENVDWGDECMICLEELSMGLPLGIIHSPCSHFFILIVYTHGFKGVTRVQYVNLTSLLLQDCKSTHYFIN